MKTKGSFGNSHDQSSKKSEEVFNKKNHLLAIAIDHYPPEIGALNNAVRDALEFEKIALEKYNFTSTKKLIDEEANLNGIIDTFDSLRKAITEDDNLIIYFSGHGELVNNRGYWIPSDAVAGERHTYLSNHEIRDLLRDIKAHHVFVIVDACFSGALLSRSRSTSAERYYQMPSRWVMTSGQVEPVPDGLPGHHSPFAESLLSQLRHNPEPFLSVNRLWLNMREGIVTNSKQTPACEPVRETGHQGGEFYFIDKDATRLPDPKPKPDPIPVPFPPDTPDLNTLQGLKKALRARQMDDDLKGALQILVDKLKENSQHKQIVYLRLANINRLEKQEAAGTATNSSSQKAQIGQALLYIIENLTQDDLN